MKRQISRLNRLPWPQVLAVAVLGMLGGLVGWLLLQSDARAAGAWSGLTGYGGFITLSMLLAIGVVLWQRCSTRELAEREQVFRTALDQGFSEIYIFDADSLKFLNANQSARENLGYSQQELSGMTPLDIKPEYDRAAFAALGEPLRTGKTAMVTFETCHRRKDGSTYPVEIRLQLSDTGRSRVFLAIVQDISEREAHARELEHRALHDPLSGLPGRTLLLDRMEQALSAARRAGTPLMLIILDPSRMQEINDILGHANGDLLLKQVAQRLKGLFRAADTIARLSADEYAILLPEGVERAAALVERIRRAFQAPFLVDGSVLRIDFSIGIAVYPQHGDSPSCLIQHADIALRVAKMERLPYAVFRAEDNPFSHRRLRLLGDLHSAIEGDQIDLHYQPQVELESEKAVGVEALARWFHPDEGQISPAEFVPMAEQTGLIGPLTECVLRRAVRQSRLWKEAGVELTISVNLSVRNLLDKNFPAWLAGLLGREGVAAGQIALEITEDVLMRNPEATLRALHELHAMGLGLHIDDYGTGYSSLSYLRHFPVDCLKIDRSFVGDILVNEQATVIVHSTIDLARKLGLRVIAEGVEEAGALDLLRSFGCDQVQGFIYSRPLPPDVFLEWLGPYQGVASATARSLPEC
ncbi:bifunctional diguanylate cyclase/phosphodiesterase [Thiohalobacter sp. IOR34]|uniref:putative bifunctional diguanylate cyclase/phosphodiesterase n=1 Tax=Thiohalobacter sp. IOR34 TaxID=3057176 RepID=UPI0025AFC2AD|nr:bifunctional diguanylate cyclase/phosphodiesterase [Thiohalobacter sp. IOR34]WJW76211.1 bifunctional diguanylate cyclase/phosphodiesterase [Thiohalobacter sp. IOR34]